MKNLLKNRIVVGLICIITALIICFGLTPMFNDALKSKVELVRVTTEIKKGDEITAKMVTAVEVGGYNLPSNVVYKAEDIVGKYANTDLYKGDYVLSSKLSDTPMLKNDYLSKLNGENRAISITIKSFAAGLSAKLERGDIVSLIASDVGEQRKTVIPTELQYLEIIATTTSDGNDNNVQEAPKDGEDAELASTITVLATPEQARLLAELEQTGKLHAALVYRGGSENAQKFLDEQAKVLGELYPKAAAESEGKTDESKDTGSTQTPPAGEAPDTESTADTESKSTNE
ncbi:MAG: RcpC/CpaB family pilus assembly protein [Clostridia bacterium]